jgi:hypothetical protein
MLFQGDRVCPSRGANTNNHQIRAARLLKLSRYQATQANSDDESSGRNLHSMKVLNGCLCGPLKVRVGQAWSQDVGTVEEGT